MIGLTKRQAEALAVWRRAISARTHCRHGHEWTPETIRYNARGARYCRACMAHPRVLKSKPRVWTDQRIAQLRTLAEAGVSKKRAAQILRVGYEALRTAAEVHRVRFAPERPGRPRTARSWLEGTAPTRPFGGFVVAGSLSELLQRLSR